MIELDRVSKWYDLPRGGRHHVYRDLSLKLPARTNIGILGRNGAGKSTLIRMIAGIDPPSVGRVRIEGRVSPPIGVSGGLSNWLTGAENAKFVCRIFGDSEAVMKRRLAFIREFAQLEHYFDQPIRTYSSGMRARFGFAISLAFDYDYYLIDEVTAVGDERFRRRANAMFASKQGVAGILLVSHNVESLREQCSVGLHVSGGAVRFFDDINDAISAYRKENR